YWMFPGGAYSLEWYHDWFRDGQVRASPEAYYEATESLLPAYVRANFAGTFELVDYERREVGGRPAVRFLAKGIRDGLPALVTGTSIWFGDRIALALHSLRIPDDASGPPDQFVHWPRYDRFCESIRRLDAPE
ncbi:MAG TPA: hypothetical protein VNI20_01205, partial [Fimbriimonadaceae bacterium]|nr:hypothetical protein [Fimbriimonadaceae bacterium]